MSSMQPIQLSEIKTFMDMRDWDADDREDFVHYVRFMDSVFLRETTKK